MNHYWGIENLHWIIGNREADFLIRNANINYNQIQLRMPFQQFLNKINPRKLFLIDSLGALLSAFLLGYVLVKFESTFGMPPKVLYILASIAGAFAVYSFVCFLGNLSNWRRFMRIIAIVNLLYCCLTLGLVIYLYQELSVLGVIYFVLEIIIIVLLAMVELKTASNSNPSA